MEECEWKLVHTALSKPGLPLGLGLWLGLGLTLVEGEGLGLFEAEEQEIINSERRAENLKNAEEIRM
jgi:hypothetical protein